MLLERNLDSVFEKSGTVVPLKIFKNREVAEGEGGPRRGVSSSQKLYEGKSKTI